MSSCEVPMARNSCTGLMTLPLAAVAVVSGIFLILTVILPKDGGFGGCKVLVPGEAMSAFGKVSLLGDAKNLPNRTVFCCVTWHSGNRGGPPLRAELVTHPISDSLGVGVWLIIVACVLIMAVQFLFLETRTMGLPALVVPLPGMVGLVIRCVNTRESTDKGLEYARELGIVCDDMADPNRGDAEQWCAVSLGLLWAVCVSARVLLSTVKPVYVWRCPVVEKQSPDAAPDTTGSTSNTPGSEVRDNPLCDVVWQQQQRPHTGYSFNDSSVDYVGHTRGFI
eukprot:TRINITY_DN5151_c0_g1_i1.p1 TRINITY_DN5151_c0_g1~~TRINITY_DN5151_c0_g1_i1.p1  ORF type:complete len:280 (+),score=27.68 TRINITY_DN5151_c0_g1_i1:332-1171(+)